jgi:phosphatidylglycerol:prolipoprotein diacylglycerol transferase
MAIYGMSLTVAFVVGYMLIRREGHRSHIAPDQITDLCVYGLIGAVCGSRLFYILYDPDLVTYDRLEILKFWQGGFVFYGGLCGALLIVVMYCKRKALPVFETLDLLVPGMIMGQAIGQFGCLLSGCMYGRPCEYPWAVVYQSSDTMAIWGLPLHPAPLYAAGMSLGIYYLLIRWRFKKRFAGELFWLYVLLDAINRLIVDLFRGDYQGIRVGNLLSISQIIGGLLIILSIMVLFTKKRKKTFNIAAK